MLSQRAVRLLVVLACIASVAALIQHLRFSRQIAETTSAAAAAVHELRRADRGLADMRTAQAAYLATGQGEAFWFARFTELSTALDTSLAALSASARDAAARQGYQSAAALLPDLAALDQRARSRIADGQRFLASDVIFAEALELNSRIASEVTAAGDRDARTAATTLVTTARWQAGVSAAALLVVLGVAIMAYRAGRAPLVIAPSIDMPVAALPAAAVIMPPAQQGQEPAPARLGEAADLCVDFGRLLDARDLQALVGRTAGVLEAKGVVLWMADDERAQLRPSLAHGYSDKVLQRLGVLSTDADNLTSLAFRSLQPQVLSGSGSTAGGAIAVPLITAHGCVGVLSAEVPRAQADSAHLALARIIAAQLALIVAPAAAEPAKAAQA